MNYTITFACYNQVDYTKQCLESMESSGTPLSRVVVVDNASSDKTIEYLKTKSLAKIISNKTNLGCGVAWNQGALETQSEWTVIMNNDVIVSRGWIEGMLGTATERGLDIISPSMIEGPLNYNFEEFAKSAQIMAKSAVRIGWAHAVCLAVHSRVWQEVGYFRAAPKLLGYEDTIFFHEARKAGMRIGTTGSAWLHHFGSITQSAMKRERGLKESQDLGYRYNHRLLNQSWLDRKLDKIKIKAQLRQWRDLEVASFGHSLWGKSGGANILWR
jgi:GT2 family glycosyltransferase